MLLNGARAELREAKRDAARDGLGAVKLGIRSHHEGVNAALDVRGHTRAKGIDLGTVSGRIAQRDRLECRLRAREWHTRQGDCRVRRSEAAERSSPREGARREGGWVTRRLWGEGVG